MKKLFLFLVIVVGIFSTYYYLTLPKQIVSPVKDSISADKPLLAYSFEKLKKTNIPSSEIHLGQQYSETQTSTAQLFYYQTPKKPGDIQMDTVSGLLNMPKKPGTYPILVLLRGYVPDELYHPGIGTQHVAESLAQHGYITLAPDFLGFGESSAPSTDSFEARFQTYTTVLSLLSSLSTLNKGLQASYSGSFTADSNRVGIWGHSNGGHIALSILELTGREYPTVLWAPVSKSFPYSILYYSDDADDHGKALRVVLAQFEHDYDANLFSLINYFSWIKAPISIHQGTLDTEVPPQWSANLVSALKKEKVDVVYTTYAGDHNMLPSAWSAAVADSTTFFDEKLQPQK
jgi:dienelactone hydrolase